MLHATLAVLASLSLAAASPGPSTKPNIHQLCQQEAANSGYDVKLCTKAGYQCLRDQDVLGCIWERIKDPQTERRCDQPVFADYQVECYQSYKECYEESAGDWSQRSVDDCVFTKTGLKADVNL